MSKTERNVLCTNKLNFDAVAGSRFNHEGNVAFQVIRMIEPPSVGAALIGQEFISMKIGHIYREPMSNTHEFMK